MNVDKNPDLAHLGVGVAAVLVDTVGRAASLTERLARRVPGVGPALDSLEARGAEALRAADDMTDQVLRVVIRKVVTAALLEVDITAVVRDHVDLDAIAEGIDVERIIDRVDVEKIVGKVDIDGIAARLELAPILARVDVDAVVQRVDVDAVVQRVDVDAVIRRVDLVGLADTVIDGVDLPAIIRESTGTMSTEAVNGVRSQGMRADDAVAGFVGRVLRRHPENNAVAEA
jgi:hypothetical protein